MSNLLSLKNIYKMFNKGTVDETTLFDDFNLANDIKRVQGGKVIKL